MAEINLTEISKQAHTIARSKGFWDTTPDREQQIALMFGELFEALEADRHGKWLNKRLPIASDFIREQINSLNGVFDPGIFVQYVKDTGEDELADVIIRGFDTIIGYDLMNQVIVNDSQRSSDFYSSFGDFVMTCVREYVVNEMEVKKPIIGLMNRIFVYAKAYNIDLMWHIKMKMAYNSTRPALHGKQY